MLARDVRIGPRATYGHCGSFAKSRPLTIVLLVTILCPSWLPAVQFTNASVKPDADAFVRSAAPASNYGGAGAIAVSGAAAVNASNQQNGSFDSLVRFPTANLISNLDATLGTHDWIILSAKLGLTEVGAPNSSIFNVGVGTFEVRWIAADSWIEGTGNPASPTTDGVTWNSLPSMLNGALDVSLGQFANSGVDGPLTFDVALKPQLVSNIRSGGPVDFYLTATSPQIGFTAFSRSNNNTNDVPVLTIAAAINTNPRIDPLKILGAGVVISFDTVSNWNYTIQSSTGLSGVWSNVAGFVAQPTNGHKTVTNAIAGGQRFFRLMLTP